ncbi:uncharacterized protein LOC132882206 isoform X3 [Neoarius graeffei]|uniref:uncharacterized protein LOC132882206 isoform X3 n=1 Tax=Neoarius graeffei TaxID=443677 RepID=UPI00298BCDFA|nr:uncharacterized protein LOC132882206 isoform X3 [Neoarius graeffei]
MQVSCLIKSLHPPVEDLLIDTYYYFHGSSKRREEYKEFQIFTGVDMEEVLKHVSTRWLSMERCVGRTLSQWPALQAYFNSSDGEEKSGRVKRCADACASEEMKLMYYFLQYALTKLNKFNIFFQPDDCHVLELEKETEGPLKAYLLNFMKVDAVNIDDMSKVDYKCEEQQKSDEYLTIGIQASRYLESISEECDPAIITRFYRSVRAAYVAAVEKVLLKKFPSGNPILKSVRILNPLHRTDVTEREVLKVAENFLKDATDEQPEGIVDDWRLYQTSNSLPPFTAADTKVDEWWARLLSTKDIADQQTYKYLGDLIKIRLILPYNQTPVERVFNMVGKTDTKFRPTLSNESLTSLLCCKINTDNTCYETKPSTSLISLAKKATVQYNTEQCCIKYWEITLK